MKHNLKITAILLAMFIVTQFIGLYVVDYYSPVKVIDGISLNVSAPSLPLGLETPEIEKESEFLTLYLPFIILAFIIAISLLFLLTKLKVKFLLRLWFFVVIVIALTIVFQIPFNQFRYSGLIALAIALPLAFFKIYRRNFLVHNFTELLVYPGIAVIFVPILNIYAIIVLLVIISIYDIWAVWHSGIMQKMAKYQINKLKVFSGFFVPYISKKMKAKLKAMKKKELKSQNFWQRIKNFRSKKSKKEKKDFSEKKKIRVNIGILGGGDVIFPLIAAGIALKTFGFTTIGNISVPLASILVIFGATLGLAYLFFFSKKKKFYPAMPFITAGIFLGILASYLILKVF